MKQYFVFLKNSVDAYNLSQKLKIKKTLAPTPREADFCCGVCIIYENKEDKEIIQKTADENGIIIDKFWEKESDIDPNRMRFC